jgi:hypothetical protein
MSAQDLTNDEVIHFTQALITAGTPENDAISRSATARPFLTLLTTARGDLAQPLGESPEIANITQQLLDEDIKVHDVLARALNGALESGSLLFPQPGLGSACRNARGALYPQGLMITRKSYVEESGAAAQRQTLRETAQYAPVWAIVFGATTLGDVLDRWNASARRLGDLHRQRATLTGTQDDPRAADVLEARRRCIRIVDAIEGAMRLEGASADTLKTTFRAWQDAVNAATLRARPVAEGTAPAPGTPPATGTPPAS